MGVDATLFVLAKYSGMGAGLVKHAFSLKRDADLQGPLKTLQRNRKHRTWPQVQLPCGNWSHCISGRPEGEEDREAGYLETDCYGGAMDAFLGRFLGELARESDGRYPDWDDSLNRAMFTFIAEHFPNHDVVVFWH